MNKSYKTWNDLFSDISNKDYSRKLNEFLDNEYAYYKIYPARNKIFNAFKLTPLQSVNVVIIGQDPYHEKGQAMGLAFSVPEGIKVPPSLINIYKEIQLEFNEPCNYYSGDLTYLAKQGVLLLNSILTVRENSPLSHNNKMYKEFFIDIIDALDKLPHPIVYLLWGNSARNIKSLIHNPNHLIIECNHPSPLSANRGGWFNSGCFLKTNQFLSLHNLKPVHWSNK